MESALSVGVNPLWVVPYTTIADDYQDLLDDFSAYVQVPAGLLYQCLRSTAAAAALVSLH